MFDSYAGTSPAMPSPQFGVSGVGSHELPQGTVTFLFTDVEGSTRLWEDAPDVMMEALRIAPL